MVARCPVDPFRTTIVRASLDSTGRWSGRHAPCCATDCRMAGGFVAARDNTGSPRARVRPRSEEVATMFRGMMVLRVCLGLALVLAAVAAVAPVAAARAQGNELASVTIYNAVCPPGYTGADYFADCYGNPGSGYTFNLAGPGYAGESATT